MAVAKLAIFVIPEYCSHAEMKDEIVDTMSVILLTSLILKRME
jgi:hypothetical protein